MTGPSEDFSHHEGLDVPGPSDDRSVPYEYPSLDEKTDYWAGRWAEFKRLLRQRWDDPVFRVTLTLSTIVFFGLIIWGLINKYLVPLVFQ